MHAVALGQPERLRNLIANTVEEARFNGPQTVGRFTVRKFDSLQLSVFLTQDATTPVHTGNVAAVEAYLFGVLS